MNKEIEMLYKTIEAKDKIINEQVLEIARLKEELEKKNKMYWQQQCAYYSSILYSLEEWLRERYDICEKHLNEMTHDREFYLTAMHVNADRKDTLDKIQELKEKYK